MRSPRVLLLNSDIIKTMSFKSFSQKSKANLALLGGGVFFGVSSPLARLMGTWLHPFSVVFIRFIFALPFALGFFYKGKSEKFELKRLWLFGLLFPVSVCLYTFSLFHTKVSLAIFSFYAANLLSSVVIGAIFNKEKISGNKLISIILATVAVIIFTKPFEGFSIDTGILLGYLSGITQTVASLYQKRLSAQTSERALTLVQVLGGLFVTIIAILAIKDWSIFTISLEGLGLGFIFGFLFFLINYFMIYGFKHTEIGIGTILLSSELLFGPLAAYIIFGEILSTPEIIGGILIAGAVLFASRHKG